MGETSDHADEARAFWTRGLFPHHLSWVIDNPLRRLVVSPATIARRLTLSQSARILELGPGSGYFSAVLAASVPQGRLELFDIQPEMLAKAESKLHAAGFRNVGYTVGNAGERLPYPAGFFDVAFLSSVLGEVSNQDRCLRSLNRVLRSDGTLAFHESIPDPDLVRFETLVSLVESNGFRFERRWGRPWNYTAVFVK